MALKVTLMLKDAVHQRKRAWCSWMSTKMQPSLWSTGSSAARLSKLTALSMSRSRKITPASSKRYTEAIKGSCLHEGWQWSASGGDKGLWTWNLARGLPLCTLPSPFSNLHSLIPFKRSHSGVCTLILGPWGAETLLFISTGGGSQETQGKSERDQICQLAVCQWRQLDCSLGHHVWPQTLDLGIHRGRRQTSDSAKA